LCIAANIALIVLNHHNDTGAKTTTSSTTFMMTAAPTLSPTSKVVIAYGLEFGVTNWEFFTAQFAVTSFDICEPYTSYTISPAPTGPATRVLSKRTFPIGELGIQQQENGCAYTNEGNDAGTISCDRV
jgi:hypothetical protein